MALRDGDGEPRADHGALAGLQHVALGRSQVEPRVAAVGAFRHDGGLAQPPQRQLAHSADADGCFGSAIRKGA